MRFSKKKLSKTKLKMTRSDANGAGGYYLNFLMYIQKKYIHIMPQYTFRYLLYVIQENDYFYL